MINTDLIKDADAICIIKRFIDKHHRSTHSEWLSMCSPAKNEDSKYLEIFAKLCGDVFGECTGDGPVDDEGNKLTPDTEFEIEIGSHDTINKIPILFIFYPS